VRVAICAVCSQESPDHARFCVACGAALPKAPVTEERKLVSVLFADLVNSTAAAERADVEDVRDALVAFQTLVVEALASFGATVEKYIGDAAVAVFGAPTVHEDDPERAVRAALSIRDAVQARNEAGAVPELHVRIGVHTGEALVALAADPSTGDRIASGDVMNTAARLQTAAPPDSVLVGEQTHRATHDAIEYEPVPPATVKGKSEPLAAWLALRARARIGIDLHRPSASPLVDRREEWEAVIGGFHRTAADERVETVTLLGAPGIGKSRLAWELALHLEREPDVVRWRHSRTPAYGERMTFFALASMVKAEAGILETDGADVASEKLAASVASLLDGAEAGWVERHLRRLVGIESTGDLQGDRRAEAFAAWRRFFEAIAARYPLVLVFEDLHWADDALLDFVEHLQAWATSRILVLATARPELLDRRPGWGSREGSTVLRVGPLRDADAHALLDGLSGRVELAPGARELLLAQAGGNPLFAEEFFRMLVDRGPGPEPVDSLPVPDSVLAIIAARVDGLSPDDKTVLQNAAVVGRAFWPGAVAHLAGRGVWAVSESLRRLEEREFVRRRQESTVQGEPEYAFAHALVRDVAYGGIVRSGRGEKHRRAAEWIEQLGAHRRDRAGTLAHHYETALALAAGAPDPELRERARSALREAAEHALGAHAHARAAELAGRALELSSETTAGRPQLLLTHAVALAFADRPAEAQLAEAATALVADGDPEGAAEAESTAAWLLALAGDMDSARAHDEQALALVADRDASATTALVLCRAGTHRIFTQSRHQEGAQLLEQALALARQNELPEIEAEALQFAGMGRIHHGDLAGVADVQSALDLALALNSVVSLSCYGNLADVRMRLGDLAGSAELQAQGLRAAMRFGMPVQVRRFRAERAVHQYWCGAWDDALEIADDYLSAIEGGQPHQMEGEMRVLRGRIKLARGDMAAAATDAERALAFGRLTGHPYDILPALAFGARSALHSDTGRAEALADELFARLASDHSFWAAWALPDAVAVATALGRAGDLVAVLEAVAMPTRWDGAALAHARGNLVAAAATYREMGALPEAAEAEGGTAFWASVGARARIEDAASRPARS
jgi:class 3 adenylate cyclase